VVSAVAWPTWGVPAASTVRPWAFALVAALVLAGVVVGLLRQRRGGVRVANVDSLLRERALRPWLVRYRALRVLGAVAILAAAGTAAVVVAQPQRVETRPQVLANRDIVLCLDVSGSMLPYGEQVVETFERAVESFEGERIALSVWNSTSRTVFPLTDDYDLARRELETARLAMRDAMTLSEGGDVDDVDAVLDFFAGTDGIDGEASLIGDGLATCALAFDQVAVDRSRSVLLATDNYLAGEPVYTLEQAADLTVARGAEVYALYPAEEGVVDGDGAQLRAVAEATGGRMFVVTEPGAVDEVVADVQAHQQVQMDADPQVVVVDDEDAWIVALAVLTTLVVLVGWRVRS
jgi:Ca-activated chloride channel homolog